MRKHSVFPKHKQWVSGANVSSPARKKDILTLVKMSKKHYNKDLLSLL